MIAETAHSPSRHSSPRQNAMPIRSRLNLAAAATIVAGTLLLATPPSASAEEDSGCAKLRKAMFEEQSGCEGGGGSYVILSASCTAEGYTLIAACQ